MDSILLFKSENFDSASKRALELGQSLERNYLNGDNQQVIWKLKEIISLDLIGGNSLDGAEVYSEPVKIPSDEITTFLEKFEPEKSIPTQTV
jgi:hypothetical protein